MTSTRISIFLPDTYLFSTELPVRITDLNYGNHLGNDSVASFLHEARARWLAEHGWSELDAGGAGLIMVDLSIRFKAQARYGHTIRIELAVQEWSTCGFTLVYRLSNSATGKEIARATTGMMSYDFEAQRLAEVPEGLRDTIAR